VVGSENPALFFRARKGGNHDSEGTVTNKSIWSVIRFMFLDPIDANIIQSRRGGYDEYFEDLHL
jgi:hypothetical protein